MTDPHSGVGPYVLDALDAEERAEFERHLRSCAQCAREVSEFAEATAELAGIAAVDPPAALRGSTLDAIRKVPPLRPQEPRTDHQAFAPLEEHPSDIPEWTTARASGPGDELAVRRSRRLNRILGALVAAVAAVALALGGWVYNLTEQRQSQAATQQQEAELLSAPDAKIVTRAVGGAEVSFVVSKSQNRALFVGRDMADPGADRDYQLWTLQGQQATPDQLVAGGGTVRVWLKGPVNDSTALALSREPAGGAQQPSDILTVAEL